jgi:hypothetical protein
MSVSDNVNQEHNDPAQTTSTSDSGGSAKIGWFSLSNVSTFKDFRDLANQNSVQNDIVKSYTNVKNLKTLRGSRLN